MGIMTKAIGTSQTQYLVSSYPSVQFEYFNELKENIFSLTNGLKKLETNNSVILNFNIDSYGII